jgi:hypothetical protein
MTYLTTVKKDVTKGSVKVSDNIFLNSSIIKNLKVFEHIFTPSHDKLKYNGIYSGSINGTSSLIKKDHDTIIYTIMQNENILIKFYKYYYNRSFIDY